MDRIFEFFDGNTIPRSQKLSIVLWETTRSKNCFYVHDTLPMNQVIAPNLVQVAEEACLRACRVLFVCNKSKLFQKGFQFLFFSPKSSETSISEVRKKVHKVCFFLVKIQVSFLKEFTTDCIDCITHFECKSQLSLSSIPLDHTM